MILNELAPILVLGIILAIAAVIALVAFSIYKFLNPKLKKDEDTVNEADAVKEELDRVLEDVTDTDVAESIANYTEEDD
jgi:hypothetical protein